MSFHWHREWELIRILEGSFTLHADEEEICAGAGDILLIRDGMLHGGTPSGCVYECFVFDLHALFRSSEQIKKHLRPIYRMEILPDIHFPHGRNAVLRSICAEIMESGAAPATSPSGECRELAVLGSLCSLFAYILRNRLYTAPPVTPAPKSDRIMLLKSVLEYIEQNYSSPITLSGLAGVVGMNPNYFCRVFREYTQQSPMDYVIFYRIEQAAELLTGTAQSITEVAMECGFNDYSYFIRTFKRLKGITPKQYRKLNSVAKD